MKYLKFEPFAGDHINTAARDAIALATNKNRQVRFSFNGIKVRVNKRLSERHVVNLWEHAMKASIIRYRNTQAFQDREAEMTAKIRNSQEMVSILIERLPFVIELDDLMRWLDTFTTHAGWVGMDYNKSAIADSLESMGFSNNQFCGNSPNWFSTRVRMGGYIVGQAINCLRSGMPPHDITRSFVEKYFALTA